MSAYGAPGLPMKAASSGKRVAPVSPPEQNLMQRACLKARQENFDLCDATGGKCYPDSEVCCTNCEDREQRACIFAFFGHGIGRKR